MKLELSYPFAQLSKERWLELKIMFNGLPGNTGQTTPFGHQHWNVPSDVLWLDYTSNEEGYDGSQTQIGIKQDGTIVWGYFSHCSCYGYEDYRGQAHGN